LGKTCVSLCRLIAIEFTESPNRTMIQKPSNIDITEVKLRHSVCELPPRKTQERVRFPFRVGTQPDKGKNFPFPRDR
jgi:hypothetical protein